MIDIPAPQSARTALNSSARSPLASGGDPARVDRRTAARESILDATWYVLARDGYEKITTRRIAERADVNIATLHYYFGTKEALLRECVKVAQRRVVGELRAAMDGTPTATDALGRVFASLWDLVNDQLGILRYDLVVRGFRDPAARTDARAIYAVYRKFTEEIIRRHLAEGGSIAEGLTVECLAHYLVAAVDGVLLQRLLTGGDHEARQALEIIRRHAVTLMGGESRPGQDTNTT